MRRQLVSVAIFGTMAAASVVGSPAAGEEPAAHASAPLALQRTSLPALGMRDEAAMVFRFYDATRTNVWADET